MGELVAKINRGTARNPAGNANADQGHHFPAVGLVAVIDADAMLFSADFRGEERMAQLLTQVAGRAGRAVYRARSCCKPTTRSSGGAGHAERGIRRPGAGDAAQPPGQAGMPPAGQLMIVRSDCSDPAYGEKFCKRCATGSRCPRCPTDWPLPSPMQRRAGKFRCQLILLAPDRRTVQPGQPVPW